MSKDKLSIGLLGAFVVFVVGALFWGTNHHDETTTMEVLSFPNPEQVKEEVEAKVEEVKEAVEEKAEEIIKEVEQIKEMLPETPEIEETPAPTLEEIPEVQETEKTDSL